MIPGGKDQPTLFQPPTLFFDEKKSDVLPLSSPTAEETPRIFPTPACTDNLRFIEDLTIPDGTNTQPGEFLDKRWLVENAGSCNWSEDYRVKLVSGPAMGVPEEQALYPARSGTQAVIRMIFVIPKESGLLRSAWQAYNPNGEAFGDPFFIEVLVQSP